MPELLSKTKWHVFMVHGVRVRVRNAFLPESVWRGVESNEILGSKDNDTGSVETEQLNVVGFATAKRPTFRRRRIGHAARHSLSNISQHGYSDEETSHVVKHESPSAGLRVLEPSPQPASYRLWFGGVSGFLADSYLIFCLSSD